MIKNLINTQIIRYIVVGGTAFLLEMAVLFGLRNGLGVSPVLSVAMSFWVGFIAAFLLQKLITFRNYDKTNRSIVKQVTGYVLLVAWNYVFTLLAVWICHRRISVYVIRTFVIITTTIWNFYFYKKLFRPIDD